MASNSMKNFPLILALIYFSFNREVIIMTIVASAPSYFPEENIPLDCGSPDNQTADDGRVWIADHDKDSRYSLKELEGQSKSIILTAYSQDSAPQIPYMTARVSRSQFTYSFRVTSSPKFIRLHFYPSRYRDRDDFDPAKAFFTVKAGGFTLLRNFSAYLTAQSTEQPDYFAKEFCIDVGENIDKLDITFLPSSSPSSENQVYSSYVFINGIEIVSMPTTLYYTPVGEKSPRYIGQQNKYGDYSDKALQTVYRLNVGGSAIPPMQDTGMYREWTSDSLYFIGVGYVLSNTSKRLNYSIIPKYAAPDNVYKTAVIMGDNATRNNLANLTWRLPVDSGFDYLVRLHFCEFDDFYTKVGDRVFRINIDNQTAVEAFSVIFFSGQARVPIYRDYVVNIKDEAFLFVDLHTSETYSLYSNVILNGMEVFKLSDQEGNLAGPNPQPLLSQGSNPTPIIQTTGKSKSHKTLLAIALGSGIAGFLFLLSMVSCVVLSRLRKEKRRHSPYKRKSSRTISSRKLPEQLCHRFSFSEIKSATNNFDQALVIGRGGFGYVYRGHIDDDFPEVAIKRLSKGSRTGQGEREFEAEIKMLSQLRHVHLVSLIGYCDDGDEMILVYDYMANGTLRNHLYGTNNDPLSWKQRLEICVGAARGLHYLHAEVKDTVIHRDVKTTNILLDEKFVAKVADFGLSRVGRGDSGAVSTAVKGTFGYMDPEYAQSRQLTDKSDVYSFGVVLFEVLCARKPVDVKLEEEQRNLAQWARRCIREGKVQDIIDPYLMGKISPECFKNFVQVAEMCVRDHRNQRPTMRDVTEKLEFALDLQEKADAAKQGINPNGVYVFPELSFHLLDDHDDHGHRHEYDVLGLHGGTDFTTTVGSDTAGSSLTLDSENGKRGTFSENSKSKSQV